MNERAERLRERIGDKLDEWFADNPEGDAYEIVPVVLRAIVEELDFDDQDVRSCFHAAEEFADRDGDLAPHYRVYTAGLALAALLEAAGVDE